MGIYQTGLCDMVLVVQQLASHTGETQNLVVVLSTRLDRIVPIQKQWPGALIWPFSLSWTLKEFIREGMKHHTLGGLAPESEGKQSESRFPLPCNFSGHSHVSLTFRLDGPASNRLIKTAVTGVPRSSQADKQDLISNLILHGPPICLWLGSHSQLCYRFSSLSFDS